MKEFPSFSKIKHHWEEAYCPWRSLSAGGRGEVPLSCMECWYGLYPTVLSGEVGVGSTQVRPVAGAGTPGQNRVPQGKDQDPESRGSL